MKFHSNPSNICKDTVAVLCCEGASTRCVEFSLNCHWAKHKMHLSCVSRLCNMTLTTLCWQEMCYTWRQSAISVTGGILCVISKSDQGITLHGPMCNIIQILIWEQFHVTPVDVGFFWFVCFTNFTNECLSFLLDYFLFPVFLLKKRRLQTWEKKFLVEKSFGSPRVKNV